VSSTLNADWLVAVTLSDNASAQMMATLFRAEGVPAEVIGITPRFLGEAGLFEIRVPVELLHRAHWLMKQSQVTYAELTFLATGELEGGDNADR
jgi:hypothetical protein